MFLLLMENAQNVWNQFQDVNTESNLVIEKIKELRRRIGNI